MPVFNPEAAAKADAVHALVKAGSDKSVAALCAEHDVTPGYYYSRVRQAKQKKGAKKKGGKGPKGSVLVPHKAQTLLAEAMEQMPRARPASEGKAMLIIMNASELRGILGGVLQ